MSAVLLSSVPTNTVHALGGLHYTYYDEPDCLGRSFNALSDYDAPANWESRRAYYGGWCENRYPWGETRQNLCVFATGGSAAAAAFLIGVAPIPASWRAAGIFAVGGWAAVQINGCLDDDNTYWG